MITADILHVVAKYYDLTLAQLRGPSRHHAIARPRMVAQYLCRALTDASFPDIGRALGGRHHTTVIYNARALAGLVLHDPRLAQQVAELTALLTNKPTEKFDGKTE